jgi:hypothetical protein
MAKLDEMKQYLEIEPNSSKHSLEWGIAWFSHGRIAINTKKLGPTLGRKSTMIRQMFEKSVYEYQHMNRGLLIEFQQRFPQVTTKEAYAWSWRITRMNSDISQTETTEMTNSEDWETSYNDFSDDWDSIFAD